MRTLWYDYIKFISAPTCLKVATAVAAWYMTIYSNPVTRGAMINFDFPL